MQTIAAYALVPLAALAAGLAAGFLAARLLGLRGLLWTLGAFGILSLGIIAWLATVGEGEEAGAFLPFAALTGAVFPALFGAIAGGVIARTLFRPRD